MPYKGFAGLDKLVCIKIDLNTIGLPNPQVT